MLGSLLQSIDTIAVVTFERCGVRLAQYHSPASLRDCMGGGMQVQGVTKFVANRNLPMALKEDISRHLEGSQVIRNEQGEGDVFSRLSHTLQVSAPAATD